MPLDEHNLMMAIATGLISALFYVTSFQNMPFPTTAAPMLVRIMVLPKITFVLLCSPFLSPLLNK